ncbi:ABC transporter permease subunit [Patulibacter americanus]|uniref:ABC transporter permease subunit n=1 Tax=Patulibacter americanus TaxID=588672 RepID=UPI0003B50707|nr:ABC transporter permease subunit [Patulibacter americanus]
MSTATVTAPAGRTTPRTSGPSLGLLVRVELRKATDTRAGRWLLGITAGIALLVAVLGGLLGSDADRTLGDIFALQMLPLSVFLPVVGILTATGEWSQRTALTTFALVPRRGRVVAAKVLAALLLGLAALVVAFGLSCLGAVLASSSGAPDAWDASGAVVGQGFLALEVGVLWAMAFGLVLANPAAAIVAYFALPIAFSVVGELVPGLDDAWQWLDPNQALERMPTETLAAGDWGKFAVSCVLWIAIPLAVGVVRTLRREVK